MNRSAQKENVAILGAGPMGLAAAYQIEWKESAQCFNELTLQSYRKFGYEQICSKRKCRYSWRGPNGFSRCLSIGSRRLPARDFEADDRIGGMTAAFDFNGLTIERYYHFHCISDHAFLQTLDELGLADKMHWVETKMGYWTQG